MIVFQTDNTKHIPIKSKTDLRFGKFEKKRFANQERYFRIKNKIRGKDVALIASITAEPESVFDLFALLQSFKDNRARRRHLCIPYFGYARQDKATKPGEVALGVMISKMLGQTKQSRIWTFDLHSKAIKNPLGPKHTEISFAEIFAQEFAKNPPEVIVAPDKGALHRARALARALKTPTVASILKQRPRPGVAVAKRLNGNVRGKRVLIIDDMIDTGGTIVAATKLLKANGVKSISICATHGIFSQDGLSRVLALKPTRLIVTNSLPQKRRKGLKVIDIGKMINQLI